MMNNDYIHSNIFLEFTIIGGKYPHNDGSL